MIARVLEERAVGSFHVREASAPRRLYACRSRFRDLLAREPEHTVFSRPRIAADLNVLAFLARVKREELHFRQATITFQACTRVRHVPAEMPDGGALRIGRRRRVDL